MTALVELFSRGGERILASEGQTSVTRNRKCVRCGGQGGSDAWVFTGWKCYRCAGHCIDPVPETIKLYTAERLAVLNERLASKRAREAAAFQEKLAKEAAEAAAKTEDFTKAFPDVVAWLKCETSDFAKSLLAQVPSLSEKQIEVVRANIARDAAEAARKSAARHVGKVGERVTLTCTVQFRTGFDTQFGWKSIVSMLDQDGNCVVVKSTSFHAEKGETLTLKATVKEHGEYRGEPQTVLARVKVLEEATA